MRIAIPGLAITLLWAGTAATAAPQPPAAEPEVLGAAARRQARGAIDRGLQFLQATQRQDGSWQHHGQSDPAITALAARCFIQDPRFGPDHPIVERALGYVLTFRRADGGIYPPGAGLRNYYSSVCLSALASTGDARYQPQIEALRTFLKNLQWDNGEDIDQENTWYGGAGYGRHKRPDLSNTQMMLEALKDSGLPPEDPAYRKALKFIQRCQMLSGSNDQPFARGATDGGFVYTPVGEGESKAGSEIVEGRPRLRTYGSMTYAGFKSYLYAQLPRDDPRVQAAWEWIRRHYTLEHNPNMPGAQSLEGLYYYYHVFAKALQAWGAPVITTASGRQHNWREDLIARLSALQNADGSWVNTADRWYEDNPMLVTSYALLALQAALP